MSPRRLPREDTLVPYRAGFPPGARWLVLAPHPDDEVLGLGATLAAARRRGVEVTVIIVTDGAAQGDAATREREARTAAERLGLEAPRFWRLADRSLSPADRRVRHALAEALAELEPDVLFVTSPVELHPDHRSLALAVQRTLRRRTLLGLRERAPAWVATYEVATPILPNLLVAGDEEWECKRRAVSAYASQLSFHSYDAVTDALGALRSLTLEGCRRAEAFYLLRSGRLARCSARRWAAGLGSPRALGGR